MTLIELLVAMTVLAIAVVGLMATVGASFRVVALTRARQVAESAANKRLEELRDIDYPDLALDSAPAHSPDPNNPDFYVSASGTQYNYLGKTPASYEDLIVDTTTPGQVEHLETPVTVGTTVVDVYQYVTWVDDPSIPGTQNLKRVTVVVAYHSNQVHGTANMLRESAVFSPGTVTLGGGSVTTSTSTTTAPPTSTTTVPGVCGSFTLGGNGGAQSGFTATTTVTINLSLAGCGVDYVDVSNDGTNWTNNIAFSASNPTLAWTLLGGDGAKAVSVRAHSGIAGAPISVGSQSIILDTTPPTVPASLTSSASCAGSQRTAVLAWQASTDANLVGYHLYRSTDGVSWTLVTSSVGLSATNVSSKSLTSTRYYVAAYDKAGNESGASNTISYAKNKCS